MENSTLVEEPFLVVSPTNSMLANGSSVSCQSSLLQRITKLVQENDSLKKCLVENNIIAKKMLNDITKWKTSERSQSNQTILQLRSKVMTLERQLQKNRSSEKLSRDFTLSPEPGDGMSPRSPKDTPSVNIQDLSHVADNHEEMNNLRKINMYLTQTLQKYKDRILELENTQPSVEVVQMTLPKQREEVEAMAKEIKAKDGTITSLKEDIKELEEELSCLCEKVDEIEMENCTLKEKLNTQNVHKDEPKEDQQLVSSSSDDQSEIVALKEQVSALSSTISVAGQDLQKSYTLRIETLERQLAEKEASMEDANAKLAQTRDMFDALNRSHKKTLKDYTDLWAEMETKTAAATKLMELKASQEKEASKSIAELNRKLAAKDTELERMLLEQVSLKEKVSQFAQAAQELDAERENVQLLKMQMDLYQTDFQAERSARETQNSEILALKEQLQELAKQNDRLKHDLEMLSSGNLAPRPMRGNSHNFMPNQWQEAAPSIYGNSSHGPHGPHDTQSQRNLNGRGIPIYDNPTWNMSYSDSAPEPDTETSISCPKCHRVFPDIDSLQIHMMYCLK